MNKKCAGYILVFVVAGLCLALSGNAYYRVRFVYDGDTIELENGEKVRYLGIDAPEVDHEGTGSQFMAHAAWKFNRTLLKGAEVRLERDREKRDHYGRLLAYVFLRNGKMVNVLMVRNGLAHVMFYPSNLRYRRILLESQRAAMKEKRGIWNRNLKEKTGIIYLGNRKTLRFHRPGCPFSANISGKHRVLFETRFAAYWEGYSPCRKCRPEKER
ncbi:MAG: nuclease (SNase domain-containing protein) [Deltaproteobacteria bacterium]|nr:MAG: hypothetical protein B5M55_04005 [Desulfococcus sp. 4484_242]RLC28912.1 MAG: nuclease (SNase domain-containing protein) [Deltaproteobacteria bacterium]